MAFVPNGFPLSHSSFRPSKNLSTRQTSASLTVVPTRFARGKIRRTSTIHASAETTGDNEAEQYESRNAEWIAQKKSATAIIEHALSTFPNDTAIAFSGAEDVVLIEFASRTKKPFRVFSLDTGRLHPETYRFFAEVEKHYGIKIEYTFPDATEVMELVNEKGMFSFYEDGHQECCRVRKVRPLRRKLSTLRAWITGQRKDQSPGTRAEIPVIQLDPAFKGVDDGPLIKYNPLAGISSSEVWATIRSTEIPYNTLHTDGFISIGCEPCTRPVLPNQHEREGRWWWEEATQKECGLHKGNIATDSSSVQIADDYVMEAVSKNQVTVFTKAGCQYCKAIKELFDGLGVRYADYVISSLNNYGEIVAALERMTGQKTAPNLFIGGKHVGGNEETQQLHANGRLIPMLNAVGVQSSISV